MFLHSGASLHGHEYSHRQPGQYPHPGPRRSPLLRSAFASPPSNPAVSFASPLTASPVPTTSLPVSIIRPVSVVNGQRPATAIPPRTTRPRPVSDGSCYAQRFVEPVVRFQDPVVVADSPARRLPSPATFNPPKAREPMSEDEANQSASEASYMSDQASVSAGTTRRMRRRRAPRKSTAFIFAHPAPKLSTKKHLLQRIRPTLLMQLQQLSDRRPLPVVDVYPASLIAGNVVAPRFSKLPRLFGVNGELGLHDTILVRNGDYDTQSRGSESDADDDAFDQRPLLAVLSPLRQKDRSEIVLEDGTVWTATAMPTGSFDFVCNNNSGRAITARWVRRIVRPDPAADGTPAELECKYTFSVLNPDSRRHPILATLTKTSLDVLDFYTTVSASSGRYPPSRAWNISPGPGEADASNDEEAHEADDRFRSPTPSTSERTTHPVDGALRDFICITAIWIAIQMGWAQTDGALACPSALNSSSTAESVGCSGRSVSGSLRRRSMPVKTEDGHPANGEVRGRRILSLRRNRPISPVPTSLTDRDDSPSISPRISQPTPTFSTKASSTGAAYVQRRKQLQQMSDTSDSERPSLSGIRRSRAFSRLSGDFTPDSYMKQSQSPSLSLSDNEARQASAASRSPSLRYTLPAALPAANQATHPNNHTIPNLNTIPALRSLTPSTPLPRGGRRPHSAYYPSNPVPMSDASGTPDLQSSAGDSDLARWQQSSPALDKSDKGGNAKWKKLGSWLKKLGGH